MTEAREEAGCALNSDKHTESRHNSSGASAGATVGARESQECLL